MIDSTWMSTILRCERVISPTWKDGVMNMTALWCHFLFILYILHLAIFLLIKQLFKTGFLTTKRGKVQLSDILTYFYTFSLGKTNDFVLTSFKVATLIFSPSIIDFFISFFTKKRVFYFKMSYESTQKIFQCCICCSFCFILKFSEWIFCRKKNSFIY